MEHIDTDPLLVVLLAQLIDRGTLDASDLTDMTRRLIEGGDGPQTERLRNIMLSCMVDTPENRRAAIHVLRDGGNEQT